MSDYLYLLKQNAPGNKVIFSDTSQQYTINEICRRSESLIDQLKALGISSLGLYADNSIDWVVADLACQKAGIILLPLPTFFSAIQLKHAIESCKVTSILTDSPQRLKVLLAKDNVTQLAVENSCLSLITIETNEGSSKLPKETDKITFTSGSTGQAKGVCLSNTVLLKQAQALVQTVNLKSPRHLCVLPLSTLLENVAGIYAPLLAGGEIVIPHPEEMGFKGSTLADQGKFLAMINRIAPNSIIVIPQLLMLLVHAIKSGWQLPASLKFVAVGGSKVSSELLKEASELGLPVYEGYGLSECTSVVSLNTVANNKPGSCGKPLPSTNVQIVDGEVVVAGNTMLGYVNTPESWHPSRIETGDLGHIGNEGYLYIQGRKKNVLISSYGRNISPEWIESELLGNPVIAEAVVIGDALPYCTALIFPRCKETSNTEIQNYLDLMNKSLPDYARVLNWYRLPFSLSSEKGLMTENGRPKRTEITGFYKKEIENLYKEKIIHVINKKMKTA